MKHLVLLVVWCMSLVFNLIGSDIYQKGTFKLIPDNTFAQGCDWSKLFTANLPTPPQPYMETHEYLALAPDKTIYVIEHNNYNAGTVFKFAADGTLLSTKADMSGKVNPSVWAKHLELPAVNDTNELWISEYTRLNRCDTEGNVLAVTRLDHPITDLLFLKGGALMLSGYVVTGQPSNPIKLFVSLLNAQTAKEAVIANFNEKAFNFVLKLEKGQGMLSIGTPRGSVGKPFIAGTPDGNLVVGYSDSPEILLFSSEGRKIGGFTLPIQRPTLNPEQKNEAVQRISQSLDSLAADKKVSPDEIERAREKLKDYPTALPYYSNLLTDDQGNILVFLIDPLNSANVEFMAFSQSGNALGTCRFILPRGVSLRVDGRKQMAIHAGWLYALIHKNISGKEQVQLARFKFE
jgi:hypothetical protein